MPKARLYSPQLEPDLISSLYHAARSNIMEHISLFFRCCPDLKIEAFHALLRLVPYLDQHPITGVACEERLTIDRGFAQPGAGRDVL